VTSDAPTLVLSLAFRAYLNGALASLASLSTLVFATFANDLSVRLLGTLAGTFFLVIAADALIPVKMRIRGKRLNYRNTFTWTSWSLGDIERLDTVEERWLGMNVTFLILLMKDGRVVRLEDTMARAGSAGCPGGPGWAGQSLSAESGIPVGQADRLP
jgi:hypothetical protein